jgi:hypothetical protein
MGGEVVENSGVSTLFLRKIETKPHLSTQRTSSKPGHKLEDGAGSCRGEGDGTALGVKRGGLGKQG